MATRSEPAVEAEGGTIDEAIASALATLGIPRERAEVEILQDAKRGVLGFGGQPARVRVFPSGAPAAVLPVPSAAERAAVSNEDSEGIDVLRKLLALMDVPGEIEAVPADEPEQTWLRITSPAGGLLIGRHGQTLDALEYIVNRIVGRHEERAHRVLVDAERYRERRSQELREMASRIAARVRQTARAHTMNPLSPRERRIVHMALAADPSVGTTSVGEGHLRRVVISPAAQARDSGRTPTRS